MHLTPLKFLLFLLITTSLGCSTEDSYDPSSEDPFDTTMSGISADYSTPTSRHYNNMMSQFRVLHESTHSFIEKRRTEFDSNICNNLALDASQFFDNIILSNFFVDNNENNFIHVSQNNIDFLKVQFNALKHGWESCNSSNETDTQQLIFLFFNSRYDFIKNKLRENGSIERSEVLEDFSAFEQTVLLINNEVCQFFITSFLQAVNEKLFMPTKNELEETLAIQELEETLDYLKEEWRECLQESFIEVAPTIIRAI